MMKGKRPHASHSRKLSPQAVSKQLPLLRVILQIRNFPQRRMLLKAAGPELVDAASSVARNVLNGYIKIKNPVLRKTIFGRRRQEMEKMASLSTPRSAKLAMLRSNQKGAFLGAISKMVTLMPNIIRTLMTPGGVEAKTKKYIKRR